MWFLDHCISVKGKSVGNLDALEFEAVDPFCSSVVDKDRVVWVSSLPWISNQIFPLWTKRAKLLSRHHDIQFLIFVSCI